MVSFAMTIGSYGSVLTHCYAGKSTRNKWKRTDIGIESIYMCGNKPVLSCCSKILSTVWRASELLGSSCPSWSLKNWGLWAHENSSSTRCQTYLGNFCFVRIQEKNKMTKWDLSQAEGRGGIFFFLWLNSHFFKPFLIPRVLREQLGERNCHQSRITLIMYSEKYFQQGLNTNFYIILYLLQWNLLQAFVVIHAISISDFIMCIYLSSMK